MVKAPSSQTAACAASYAGIFSGRRKAPGVPRARLGKVRRQVLDAQRRQVLDKSAWLLHFVCAKS
jgi:hypothetical protein